MCYCPRERRSFKGYSCHPYCHICVSSRPAVAQIAEIVILTDIQIRICTCSLLCMAYSVVRSDCIVTVPLAKHQLIGFKSIAEAVFTARYELNL
jgi:hypothetical protein